MNAKGLLIGFLCIKKGVKMRKLIFDKMAPVFAFIIGNVNPAAVLVYQLVVFDV